MALAWVECGECPEQGAGGQKKAAYLACLPPFASPAYRHKLYKQDRLHNAVLLIVLLLIAAPLLPALPTHNTNHRQAGKTSRCDEMMMKD